MKRSKKIRIFALVTAILMTLFATTAFAAEKLDQNMSGADMSFGERFEYAMQGTATGMLMVFAVLALLWGIVSLSKVFFYDIPRKKKEQEQSERKLSNAVAETVAESVAPVVENTVTEVAAQDDGELVAVITAAIAAMIESGDYGNEFVGGFRVVSFKRSTKGAWNRK